MQLDAHYYAILAFARAVGFKKEAAHTIAFASQFVDDAKINHIMLSDDSTSFLNMATSHSYFMIATFNYEAMINNTTAFHFVPGCKGQNFSKKLRCSEESPIIMAILDQVKKDDDLVKLGIALHAYADTFSHQGFSGLLSKVNAIRNCRLNSKIYSSFLELILKILRRTAPNSFDYYLDRLNPAYGHAQALAYPDIPYLQWEYKYDHSAQFTKKYRLIKINNKKRFKRAFKKIKLYLEQYLANNSKYRDEDFAFNNFKVLFKTLLKTGSIKARINNWKQIMIEQQLFTSQDSNIINYKQDLWLSKAFKNYQKNKFSSRKVEDAKIEADFKSSNWYKYYKAVGWYKKEFFKYSKKYLLGYHDKKTKK